ncbi:Uma2 family endonuclease [Nostoc sp.]|uniref:Uma2 family endonuclease n=1 Tax=Nostoc sp. TaxID=1180 RepID=UPI002FFB8530
MFTTKPVERLYTFEEYLTYDDGTDKRYELQDGVLREMPPASDLHEAIITFLLIHFYLEIQRLGLDWQVRPNGTGVRTSVKKSRLPDFIVMTEEQRQSIQGKSAVLELPPVVTVEVVSAESVKRDYQRKTLEYAAFSIPEYWIVDPLEAKVTVCLLDQGSYNQTVFTGNQQICSPTSPELTLTAQQVLTA